MLRAYTWLCCSGATPDCVQGLAICGAWGTICHGENQTKVACLQGKHFTLVSLLQPSYHNLNVIRKFLIANL